LQLKATKSSSSFKHKFWFRKQSDGKNHPVLLDSTEMYNQRLKYLQWNPVTAGFVSEPWHWKYSSAVYYMINDKGMPDLVFLE